MPAPKELDPSASLAALYGTKVRKLRMRAGWTQRELGDRIPVAHSRIAQFELGNETPPEDVNGKLDVLLGADGDLVDLWVHARRTPFPDWAQMFMTYEAKSRMMRKFSQIIPGLAQTEAYARAVLQAGQIYDDGDPEAKVRARLERQAVLQRADPLGCGLFWMRRSCIAWSAARKSCEINWRVFWCWSRLLESTCRYSPSGARTQLPWGAHLPS